MITEIELLESAQMRAIVKLHQEAIKLKNDAAYNLFSLSTYNNHVENFHSDVLASLLSPEGLHGEEMKFLLLFIDYLQQQHVSITGDNYKKAEVIREKGKLDIWIRDEQSNHSIIIENKINNAPDMQEQIVRYYNHAIANGYHVDAIIYLSLDGIKKSPLLLAEQERIVYNIGAFTNQPDDLVSGWLQPCYNAGTTENSRSLIFQYIKLIKHLNHTAMSQDAMQKFYEYISTVENHTAARTVNQLSANIGTYRRDRFQIKWNNDFAPFTKIHRLVQFDNCGTLFEDFNRDGFNYKLDVYFENNGSAFVRLWTPATKHDNETGCAACFSILKEVQMDEFFVIEYPGRKNSMIFRMFKLEDYGSMLTIDEKVYTFVKELLFKLAGLANK